jgi:hypothetical protein
MSNPLLERYKIPFLLSVVVSLAIIVLPEEISILSAILAFSGSILGFLLVDFEYIIHAYLVDPTSEFSIRIKEYVSSGNFIGLVDFYNREEYTSGEMSVRSAMFQVILAGLALMTITNQSWIFARGMVLSMSINLLFFQFQEYLKTGMIQRWFWVYKGSVSDGLYKTYMVLLLIFFIYQFTFL